MTFEETVSPDKRTFLTKVLDLSLNLDLSPFVKSAPGVLAYICKFFVTHLIPVNAGTLLFVKLRNL